MATPRINSYAAPSGGSVVAGRAIPAWLAALPLMSVREISANTIMDIRPANDPAINPNYGTGTRAPWEKETTLNNIFNEWNGGALDQVRGRFYVGGGGHSGYQGEEYYGVDLLDDVLTYSRYSTPSGSIPFPCDLTVAGADSAVNAIGRPRQVHNYNLVAVDTTTGDMLLAPGGFNTFGGGAVRGFRLSRATREWDMAVPIQKHAAFDAAGGAVYHPPTGLLWCICNGGLYSVVLSTGVMTQRASLGSFNVGQYQKLVWDSTHDIILALNNNPLTGAMSGKPMAAFTPTSSGTVTVTALNMPMGADSAGAHGADWDANGNRLLIYRGGTDLKAYVAPDAPLTGAWTEQALSLDTSVVLPPASVAANGTALYGRFRVFNQLNVAVLQNAAGNKLRAWRLR